MVLGYFPALPSIIEPLDARGGVASNMIKETKLKKKNYENLFFHLCRIHWKLVLSLLTNTIGNISLF